MSRGKLVNKVDECVHDSLVGYIRSHPQVRLVQASNVVVRADLETEVKSRRLVALISGGGSGHEPAHVGFVGRGMLTAAVCGPVFTSPSSDAILEAILQCGTNNPGGVLLIVKNYTGDRIHFALAQERAQKRGIRVATVLVDDDCAIEAPVKSVGRRGLAGVALVHKIAGAMSEAGHSLEDIVSTLHRQVLLADMKNRVLATVGLCITPCTLPGQSLQSCGESRLRDGQHVELGLGIHGEPGHSRLELTSARQGVEAMLEKMLTNKNQAEDGRIHVRPGDEVALLVNNLGATSSLEIYIVTKEALERLETVYQVVVRRVFVGHLVTSLDMGGVSLTVLRLNSGWKEALNYLDAPTEAPGWPFRLHHGKKYDESGSTTWYVAPQLIQTSEVPRDTEGVHEPVPPLLLLSAAAVCHELIKQENHLNALDKAVGDGDCGSTCSAGAKAILGMLESSNQTFSNPGMFFQTVSHCLERAMGGSSGGLWSLFFAATGSTLASNPSSEEGTLSRRLCDSFLKGASRMQEIGMAGLGDRSCLDALLPSLHKWEHCLHSNMHLREMLQSLKQTSREAADATARMVPRVGRSCYLSEADVLRLNSPDPGAVAVAVAVAAICDCLLENMS